MYSIVRPANRERLCVYTPEFGVARVAPENSSALASPGHREADPCEGPKPTGLEAERFRMMVILESPGQGTGVPGPTAQPRPSREPQGSLADFTHLVVHEHSH